MRVARILYPVHSLGPGDRIVIWVQGCKQRCVGCANPDLWAIDGVGETPINFLVGMIRSAIKNYHLNGITITGGEPFLQAKELCFLLTAIQDICNDVLVFTGLIYEELQQSNDISIHDLIKKTSVLVDGPYIQELNQAELLRGSANQRILFLSKSVESLYREYISNSGHMSEQFFADNGIISVGIHPADFQEWMDTH